MTRTARIPAMANAHSHAFQLDLRGIGERVSASSTRTASGDSTRRPSGGACMVTTG